MELRRWAGAFAVLGVLAGCGGDGASDRPDAREDEAAVKKVLEEALDALYDGDGARACSLYTSSYRRKLVEENQADRSDVAPRGDSCEEQVKNYEPILKRFVPGRDVKVIRVSVRGDNATAVSVFNTTRGKSRVKESLVRRDGEWKINDDQEQAEGAPPTGPGGVDAPGTP
jgi:hypothetical protein